MINIKKIVVCCMVLSLFTSMLIPAGTLAIKSNDMEYGEEIVLDAVDKEKPLNLYKEDNIDSEILTQISNDTSVTFIERNLDFILIEYKDEKTEESFRGYIYLSDIGPYEIPGVEEENPEDKEDVEIADIEITDDQDSSNVTETNKETGSEESVVTEEEPINEAPIKKEEVNITIDNQDEQIVSDTEDEQIVNDPTDDKNLEDEGKSFSLAKKVKLQGIVSTSSTHIYERTSTQSKSLKKYDQGSLLLFYDYSDTWYVTNVHVNGVTKVGYILKNQVELITNNPVKEEGLALKNPTNVFASPSTKSTVVRTFSKGTFLKYYTHTANWYKSSVTVNGTPTTIYIHKNDIEKPTEIPVKYEGLANANPTKLYESPSRSSKVIRTFKSGTTLKYYTYTSEWLRSSVTVNGVAKTVYIHKNDVKQDEPSSTKLEGIATAKPTKIYGNTSTNSTVYKEYAEGSVLQFFEYSYDWYRTNVNVNGKNETGYLLKSQVDLIDLEPVLIEGTAKANPTNMYTKPSRDAKVVKTYKPGSILKYYTYSSNWYRSSVTVDGKSQTIYIHKNDVELPDATKKYEGIAVTNPTNMYSKPSRDAKVVKTYTAGTILKYYTYSLNWYKSSVTVNGKPQTIYIHKDDVEQATDAPEKHEGIALANPTNIYIQPSKGAKVVKTYTSGSILKYYTYSSNWYRSSITVNGKLQTIYIHKGDVEQATNAPKLYEGIALSNPTKMYSAASRSAKYYTTYQSGKLLKYYTYTSNWYRSSVTVNGEKKTVYIHKDDIEVINKSSIAVQGITLKNPTNMYSLPSTSQKVVEYVAKGKILQYYDFSLNWYTTTVTVNGKSQTVYIKKSDVGNQTVSNYGISLSRAVEMQMMAKPQTDIAPISLPFESFNTRAAWNSATNAQVEYYLNPENFKPNTKEYYQFLLLSAPAGTNVSEVNANILKGKGVLEGKASAYINAANKYDINEIYLISHSLLETGNGTSKLATGIKYNGKTVYNVYGIGAYDSDPDGLGAKYAYEQGWFTVEDAIIGGAKFVAQNYIDRGQDTLYKMRWNPDGMVKYGFAYHQYATDIGWAVKQTTRMSQMYSQISQYSLVYDIPVYTGI